MRLSHTSIFGIVLPICATICSATTVSLQSSDVSVGQFTKRQSQTLKAVTLRSNLRKREEAFIPEHALEHHYVDHASVLSGINSRFAKTVMKYRWPALALEDIEEELSDVRCSNSMIVIVFDNISTLDRARETWDTLSGFLLVSSHPGCNGDGERAPYLVLSIAYNLDSLEVAFSVRRIHWKDAYNSMTIHFGMETGQYEVGALRTNDGLRRRQAETSSALASSALPFPSAPSAAPTSSPTPHDISYSLAGQQLYTHSFGNDSLSESITVNCLECSVGGTVEITEGSFTINPPNNTVEQVIDFWHHGYFKGVVNGFNAHVELETILSLSSTHQFDTPLVTLALPGFEIPNLVTVGPTFSPHILGSLTITADLDFTYGFNLSVPDTSIYLNIGILTNSTSSGFNQARITDIPFSASSPEITLDMSLGLRAELLLGVSIHNGDGNLDAGLLLDLPTVSVSVSQLDGVNALCEEISSSSTLEGFLSHIFPNLTHIVPQVAIDAILTVGGGLAIEDVITATTGTQTTMAGTAWTLSTACLSWDDKVKGFASPTTSTTSSTAGATSSASAGTNGPGKKNSKSAGIRGFDNPLASGNVVWWGTGMAMTVILVVISL